MADTKFSALTALTGAGAAADDKAVVLDTSASSAKSASASGGSDANTRA